MDLLEFHKSKEERNAIMSQDKEILAHLARWGGGSPAGLHVSRNTVAKVAAATKRLLSPLVWEMLSKVEFHQQIFPTSTAKSVPIIPDFNYIH